jgi:formate dehydrogenase iron-sulfur subunit
MSFAILTDVTKCIGCLECVAACRKINNLKVDRPRIWQKNDGLSANNWTSILREDKGRFVRNQCRHCLEPACASVCPVGALHQTEKGAVVYDLSKCLGCRYCMMACPYGIPRYDWDEQVPYVQKCILCYDRINEGKQPGCTEICPEKATIFGKRDELLAEAHKRIKENPGKYIDKVWGEHDVGGTSVLYISDVDLGFMTYKSDLGTQPLPKTTELAMNSVPFAFVGMGGVMLGLHWIVKRRMELKNDSSVGEDEPWKE